MTLNRTSFTVIYLLFLLCAGFVTRLHHIDTYAYGPDQAMNIQIAEGRTLGEVWEFSRYETHPPFSHFIRHLWMKLGTDIEWIRSLSFFSDMGLILLFFLLGEQLQKNTGLIAATLAAFSPGLITTAQEVRNYSFFLLFLTSCFYCYFRFLEQRSLKWLGLYMLAGCLAVGTHFGGIIPVFAITLVTCFSLYKERKWCLLWLGANGIIGLLFLFFYFAQQWTLYTYAVSLPHSSTHFLLYATETLKGLILFPSYLLIKLPAALQGADIFVVFMLMPVAIESIRKTHTLFFSLTLTSIFIWAVLCISGIYTPHERHTLWAAPFLIIIASIGIQTCYEALPSLVLRHSLALCLIIVLTTYCLTRPDIYPVEKERITKSEIASIQHYITTHIPSGDVVVGGRNSMASLYFYILHENYYRAIPPHSPLPDESFVTRILLRSISSQQVSFVSTPLYFRLSPATHFIAFFKNAFRTGWLDNASHIWFFTMMNANEFVAEKLLQCPLLAPEIDQKFTTENGSITLFSLKLQTVRELIAPYGKYVSCLSY